MKNAIILGAGKGTRMHSDLPKVLHEVCGVPMVSLIIKNLKEIDVQNVVTIVGYGKDLVEEKLKGECEFAVQEPQLGTGHAVKQAKELLKNKQGKTVVVNGDAPCIQPETLNRLFETDADMAVLTVTLKDAKSYGRVIRNSQNEVKKIVEAKDCTQEEKEVKEINTGIYMFDNELLFTYIDELNDNNAQHEYYITDLVEIFKNHGKKVVAVEASNEEEVQGVNDNVELAHANKYMRQVINEKWMRQGVTFVNPDTTYVGPDVTFGHDVTIYPNTYFYGKTTIGDYTVVTPGTYLNNATIGSHCLIDASEITDSIVKDECQIGPYAHFRMNSVIEEKNRIGNFVEFKNTHFGEDSRCAHLTYLGDSDVGSKVNIGCGVITVNYDGANKYHTVIKDGAFIGSNCNLIAPVTIGENAVVAAGSTATEDVPDTDMAIGRVRQVNKAGYGKMYLDRNRAKKAMSKK